jgi:hypothetical protein
LCPSCNSPLEEKQLEYVLHALSPHSLSTYPPPILHLSSTYPPPILLSSSSYPPPFYPPILLSSYPSILLSFYPILLSFYHSIILSFYHSIILSFYHSIILPSYFIPPRYRPIGMGASLTDAIDVEMTKKTNLGLSSKVEALLRELKKVSHQVRRRIMDL